MPLWLVAPALLAVAFFIMVLGPGRTEGHAAEKPMTDDWKLRYFGNLAVAEEDDPDRDTLSNGFEAEIGTDPTAEDSDKDGNPDWLGIASYLFQEKWQEPDGWPLHAADRRHEFNRPGGMQFFNHGAKADSTGGNAFHQRLRGKLTAPVSGDYEFWIAGDNGCELWLGVDGSRFGARRLAGLPHGNSRTRPEERQSRPRSGTGVLSRDPPPRLPRLRSCVARLEATGRGAGTGPGDSAALVGVGSGRPGR